jgi:hypothetical protein
VLLLQSLFIQQIVKVLCSIHHLHFTELRGSN